ncbi:MAG: hypothetical protein CMB80_02980 [Flammeovirgaceae bacterium]|nr:hypothetical protein [Flammeovirgaceae bacterium]
MPNEKKIQLRVFLKLLVICICAGLYAWGGMEFKWLRRFVAPAVACLFAFAYSRNWRYLIQMPVMFLTMSMGYGGDTLGEKIARRAVFGCANGISTSIVNGIKKNWLVVSFQMSLLIAAYIVFGVWNPLPNARVEETLLGLFCYAIPIMSVRYYK